MRPRSLLLALLASAAALVGCAGPAARGTPVPPARATAARTGERVPPPARRTSSGLLLSVQPPDAELFVGSASRGRVSDLSARRGFLPLPPGIYQVSLRHTGYQTWRAEVAVTDRPEPLEVQLSPRQ